jgi:hypothetical protein
VPLTLNNEDSEYKLSMSIPAGLRSYLLEIFSFHVSKTNGCEAIRVFSKMRDAKQVAEIFDVFR